MLLPDIKEREYRFRLALRMGLPIFALVLALISNILITHNQSISPSFYLISIILLVFNIYFILYIIYESFDIRITEIVSKTFTREYLYEYLKNDIKKNKEYTLILISIDNLNDINSRYGIKNGDNVLRKTTQWVNKYFLSKELSNYPMGHIKGGDFVVGFKGTKNQYESILELLNLKSDHFTIDDIEVQISTSIIDTTFSTKLEFLIENLFEQQSTSKNQKSITQKHSDINPDKLETVVIDALKNKSFIIMTQDIFDGDKSIIKECFVKLITSEEKIIHPKSYIKILDKFGLMVEFDLMVLEENIFKCNNSIDDKYVINISPSSLRNRTFISRAKKLINANKNIKDRLIFLLSEVEYYSQVQRYNDTLQSFRDMGILIAIDRLGAIHTSFLYLRDLDVDIVRFDSFYTKEIVNDKYRSIIDGFNTMAHEKGVKTWIKMVETQEIKEKAQELNIDYIQGRYLASVVK